MQRFESLFDGRLVVPAVSLIEIDVVRSKTAQGLVEFVKNSFAGKTAPVWLVAHDAVNLGGNNNGFSARIRTQETSNHLFAGARRIDVGGVKEIDAEIERLMQKRLALLLVESPGMAAGFDFPRGGRTVGHAAKTDTGDLEARLAEGEVVHLFSRVLWYSVRCNSNNLRGTGEVQFSNYAFSAEPTP